MNVATANELKEALHVKRWAIDPRRGDTHQVEQILDTLPHDNATMQHAKHNLKENWVVRLGEYWLGNTQAKQLTALTIRTPTQVMEPTFGMLLSLI